MKQHPLTAEYARFGSFDMVAENNKNQLKGLILKLAENKNNTQGSLAQKIGDVYNMAMDSVTLNKQGATPLKADLAKISAIRTRAQLYAVLGDGEGAYRMLHTLLTRSTAPNLWDLCPPYQIDGNFGGIAGIANMLVQDRGGEVRLLPALPRAFPNGSVKGLRLKGNRAADLSWHDGHLTEQRIYSCKE